METFRLCASDPFNLSLAVVSTCQDPIIFATYLLGMGDQDVTTSAMADRLTKAMTFGGGVGQSQYSVKVDFPTTGSSPCLVGITACTAIVLLPVQPDNRLAPAFLPNLMKFRVQTAAVASSWPDEDANVLWRRYEHLRWSRYDCQFDQECANFCEAPQTSTIAQRGWDLAVQVSTGMYGRTWGRGEFRVKTKRRIDDEHALFFVQNFVTGITAPNVWTSVIGVQWDTFLRYGVKRSR